MAYKVIIWGTGYAYNKYFNMLKFLEFKNEIKILAVTSNDKDIKKSIDCFPFLPKEIIFKLDYDYILVAIDDLNEIHEDCLYYTIPKEKIIPMRVISIPYFDFSDYISLKKSKLSIFSSNCWGGGCYHYCGLEFLSPTIN